MNIIKGQQNQPIRWGIIGCGAVTELKSGPAFQKVEGSELLAVMRRDEEKSKDYAQRHNVPKYYSDAEALIHDAEVDAVYVATPPDSHLSYALKVAEAGKPCCVEKPMAPNFDECQLMVDAFAAKQLPLFVAYYRRSLPRFKKIKDWIDSAAIGEPRHITWLYNRPPNEKDLSGNYNWRTDAKIAPGGYFDDLASHGLDLFNYLLGDICTASGIRANQQNLYSADDALVANWLHRGGVTGSGVWNFASHAYQDRVQILGERGAIEFSVFGHSPFILDNDEGREESVIEHPENIQFYHVQAMIRHLNGGETHPCTGRNGAHTSWVMDQILGN